MESTSTGVAAHNTTHKAPRKRARKSAEQDETQTKKPRRSGKLAKLQELPLEVLLVIFGFLHPYSLLRLSRTTKFLRKLLMTRSSRETWACSLEMVPGLPECPQDMSEPAFVRLAFDKSCYNCLKHTTLNARWPLRVRLCKGCDKAHGILLYENGLFWTRFPTLSRQPNLLSIIPTSEKNFAYAMLPKSCIEMESQLSKLEKGSDLFKQCIEERKSSTAIIMQHAKECARWERDSKTQRHQELEEGHHSRQAEVEARLDALGYGQMFRWIHDDDIASWDATLDFKKLKVMKDPKPLTDRIWANALPAVTAVMEKHREAFEKTYTGLIHDYRMDMLNAAAEIAYDDVNVPANLHAPRGAQLLTIPDILGLIEQPVDIRSQEDTLEPETILATLKALGPQHVASLSTDVQASVMKNKIYAYWDKQGKDCDDPELATSIFQCTASYVDCSPPMSYHQALYHRCLRTRVSREGEFSSNMTPDWISKAPLERLEKAHNFARKPTRVINDSIGIAPCASTLQMVITSLGLDPQTTTSADLDEADPWFACRCGRCSIHLISGQQRVFDWRHAILHKPLSKTFDALRLNQDEAAEARRVRDTLPVLVPAENDRSYRYAMVWQCVHCDKSPITTAEMVDHMSIRHRVDKPKLDDDFRTSPHCLAPFTGYVMISVK